MQGGIEDIYKALLKVVFLIFGHLPITLVYVVTIESSFSICSHSNFKGSTLIFL